MWPHDPLFPQSFTLKKCQMMTDFTILFYFSEYVLELLDRSKEQFHAFFETTYGTLYTNEKKFFLEYFSDLKKYFHLGGDLAQTTDKFFTTLFKKMFKVCFLMFKNNLKTFYHYLHNKKVF